MARGERVALVGATGAGKSTVASLFLRLYEVRDGAAKVFGTDVREWPRDELRSHFAVVPQDVFLFPGSVASNIAAGDEVPDLDRVKRALERIDALALLMRRDGGLDAKVEERGSNFSAGERQLIAFARALYKDPDVLVLDEATANVDNETESRLQRAIRIVVFHKGQIVEQGTHDELLALGGVYAKLHELQFAREELTAPKSHGSVSPPAEPAPPAG